MEADLGSAVLVDRRVLVRLDDLHLSKQADRGAPRLARRQPKARVTPPRGLARSTVDQVKVQGMLLCPGSATISSWRGGSEVLLLWLAQAQGRRWTDS